MSANALNTIDQFLTQVGTAEKAAAEAHTEPGSIGGETSHPVKNVDDRTGEAQEGERSSENSADVKEDQGEPAVDNAPEATAKAAMSEGSAADDQLQIGTNKQPTGKDPQNETSSAKPGKEDGGYEGPSSHPARTDNDDIDGHKYAGDISKMSLTEKAAALADLGNEICAAVAVNASQPKQAEAATAGNEPVPANKQAEAQPEATPDAEAQAATEKLAGQVGWEMAGIMTGTMDKQSADAMVQNALVDIVKSAEDDADNVIAYLKQAMDEEGGEPVDPKSEAGGEEPSEPSEPSAPAEEAPAPAGLDAVGPEPAPEGGDAGGEGMISIEELMMILQELGVGPEQLGALGGGGEAPAPEAAMDPMGGDPMGGAPMGADPMAAAGPEAAGAMPPVDPAAAGGMEVAASDQGELTADKTASYIKEVVQRARAKQAAAVPTAK